MSPRAAASKKDSHSDESEGDKDRTIKEVRDLVCGDDLAP